MQDKFCELYVDVIEVTGRNPRLTFDGDDFDMLVESIRKDGILEPLLINAVHSTFVLIAGERRLRAAKQLKMEKVPCYLLYGEDEESADRKQIVENEVRASLTVLEKGLAIKRYLKKHTVATQKEVAELFCIHKTDLSKAIKVTELPERVWLYIQQHRLSDGNAVALLPLLGKVTEDKLVEIATVAQTLTTKAVREMVKDTLSTSKALSDKVDNASKGLTARYGEKADIKRSGKGYVITLKVAEDELDDTLMLMGAVKTTNDYGHTEKLSEQTVSGTLNDAKSGASVELGTSTDKDQGKELDDSEDDYTLGAVLFTHSDTDTVLSIKETLAFLKAHRAGKIVSKGVCKRSKDSEQLEFEHDNGKRYKVNIPKKFAKMGFAELFDAIYDSGVYEKSKEVLSDEAKAVEEVVKDVVEEKSVEILEASTYDIISAVYESRGKWCNLSGRDLTKFITSVLSCDTELRSQEPDTKGNIKGVFVYTEGRTIEVTYGKSFAAAVQKAREQHELTKEHLKEEYTGILSNLLPSVDKDNIRVGLRYYKNFIVDLALIGNNAISEGKKVFNKVAWKEIPAYGKYAAKLEFTLKANSISEFYETLGI